VAEGDIVIKQGTDPIIEIKNVKDANNVLITNWTGYSIKGHIRERPESPTVLHEWTSQGASPNVTFSGSNVVLDLPNAVSSAWTWTHARYDVELTDPQGKKARIAPPENSGGHVIVDRETTR
jgi:hypothetical protein